MNDVAKAFVDLLRKSPELPDHVRQGLLSAGSEAVPPLLELLHDRSVDAGNHPSGGRARVHAAELLGRIGDRSAIDGLLDALVIDRGSPRHVGAVAAALAAIGQVAEPTLDRAEASTVTAERIVLSMVLASCGEKHERIFRLLGELLAEEPLLVLPLVGRYGDRRHAPAVGRILLAAGLEGSLTVAAVRALTELGISHAKLDDLQSKANQKDTTEQSFKVLEAVELIIADLVN